MKKLIIISLAILGLGVVSCQKEVLTPNTGSEMEIPVWEDNARVGVDSGIDDDDDVVIGGITDPNDENDEPIDGEDNGRTKGSKN